MVIGSNVEWHSHRDTQIVIKMVYLLGGICTMICTVIGLFEQQFNIGWSNKKQDFEYAQEIHEPDASQGSIEHIGNGYVLTATFVPGGLDQLSRLLRRMIQYELGLVRQWKFKIAEAHESRQQLGSSSIQHDRHVHQKIWDGHDIMMEELPIRLVSIDVFVKLAQGDVEVSKCLYKEYAIFSLYSKVVACECFEFIAEPLSEWMQLNRCSLDRV